MQNKNKGHVGKDCQAKQATNFVNGVVHAQSLHQECREVRGKVHINLDEASDTLECCWMSRKGVAVRLG